MGCSSEPRVKKALMVQARCKGACVSSCILTVGEYAARRRPTRVSCVVCRVSCVRRVWRMCGMWRRQMPTRRSSTRTRRP
jgi:hypothetical protein